MTRAHVHFANSRHVSTHEDGRINVTPSRHIAHCLNGFRSTGDSDREDDSENACRSYHHHKWTKEKKTRTVSRNQCAGRAELGELDPSVRESSEDSRRFHVYLGMKKEEFECLRQLIEDDSSSFKLVNCGDTGVAQ